MYTVIKTKKQYKEYLKRIEELFDCKENSQEESELELLGLLVDKYEEDNFKMPSSDPIDTLEFIMDQSKMNVSDLGEIINSVSRASEVLKRKRGLSLNHIRAIHAELNIPAETLIKDYELEV